MNQQNDALLSAAQMSDKLTEFGCRMEETDYSVAAKLQSESVGDHVAGMVAKSLVLTAKTMVKECRNYVNALEGLELSKTGLTAEDTVGRDVVENSQPAPQSSDNLDDEEDKFAEAIGNLLGGLVDTAVDMVASIASALAEQFGVQEAAVVPYIVETNTAMLMLMEDLLDRALARLESGETAWIDRAEMQTRIESAIEALHAMEATFEGSDLGELSLDAQVAHLSALALARQAGKFVENAAGVLNYVSVTPADGDVPLQVAVNPPRIAVQVSLKFGCTPEAVGPFFMEANSIMLPVIEDLIKRAQGKIAECGTVSAG